LFGRWMRAREIAHTNRDNNRVVRPFAWGLEFISDHLKGDDPRAIFRAHTARVMQRSDEFFALPEISDYQLEGDHLTWTSAVHTPSPENNVGYCQVNDGRCNQAVHAA
jgi:hypothetical protein